MFSGIILGNVLKALPRREIKKLVCHHGSDRWRKSFKSWDHLVALLTAQFSGVNSLRELEVLFSSQKAHHYHLGLSSVKRSTLSEANGTRKSDIFRDIARIMIARSQEKSSPLEEILVLLDSSQISLMDYGYEWAEESRTRNLSRGVKLHLQMEEKSRNITYAEVTSTNINDITKALEIPLEEGRIYVFDKGYCDYNWWHKIHKTGSRFVTRLKKNAAYKVVRENKILKEDQGFILKDQIIELTNKQPRAGKINELAGHPLRLINIKHPSKKGKDFMIVSNDLEVEAGEISLWYKKRWGVELLFKWVKQNLKLKRFLGRSRNAVLIQIYVAIIAYILLKIYKKMTAHKYQIRLKDTLITIKVGLFTRPETFNKRRRRRKKLSQNQLTLWKEKT